jgi:hypothetical protein
VEVAKMSLYSHQRTTLLGTDRHINSVAFFAKDAILDVPDGAIEQTDFVVIPKADDSIAVDWVLRVESVDVTNASIEVVARLVAPNQELG